MGLTPGTRLGPYEIVSPIGAGGMGEVYRAKDTNLDRDVAIKVLPESFALDGDRVARFSREAKTLAALNHPNIATIYGLESNALVMELVEGEDLSTLIARGRPEAESVSLRLRDSVSSAGRGGGAPRGLSIDDSLDIARQIADALEAAHGQGIIHRDLKPANIKVRADGTVKVLDFGLAKAMDPGGASSADAMNSPTLTGRATQMGMIIGTAAYMAPEQARGKVVDRRADIWAFGVVLFEMLTGTRAFPGDDITDTLAAVVRAEPEWSLLPPDLPPTLQVFLRRCLQKDAKQRIGDIHDVRLAMDGAFDTPASAVVPKVAAVPTPPRWRRALPITAAVIATAAATGGVMWFARPAEPARVVSRFVIPFGEGQERKLTYSQGVAISPDGATIAYAANEQIYLRQIGDLDARLLMRKGASEFRGPAQPVFSPDGRSLAYVETDNGKFAIKRIEISGGASVAVATDVGTNPSLNWHGDNIFFTLSTPGTGIMRVAAAGGRPDQIIPLESGETASRPQMLDDGRVLFAVGPNRGSSSINWTEGRIVVQRPGEKTRATLVEGGTDPRYLPSGHLLYQLNGVVYARTFDLSRTAVGGAVAVVEGVFRGTGGHHSWYAVSDAGTLVYLPGPVSSSGTAELTLALFDRAGKAEPLPVLAGPYSEPRMSPDGHYIAFGHSDARDTSIWVYDVAAAGSARRLTFGGHDRFPAWSADSQRIIFQSDREGDFGLFWQRVAGGTAQRLTQPAKGVSHVAQSAARDGRVLLVDQIEGAKTSLMTFSFADKSMTPFGAIVSNRSTGAIFSPDGRWVAYTLHDAGATSDVVYAQPFPATGEKVQISSNAEDGHHPVWSSDGKELYYNPAPGTKLAAVKVLASRGLVLGPAPPPTKAFVAGAGTIERTYDVARDGKRFLGLISPALAATAAAGAPRQELRIVLNWVDELKARAPIKK